MISDVIALARDKSQGPSRVLLLGALERSADPRAVAALMDLGTDEDLTKEIQVILRRLKRAKRSHSRIRPQASATGLEEFGHLRLTPTLLKVYGGQQRHAASRSPS